MSTNIATQIEHEVAAWDGVSVKPHRFGGIEFKVGRRELGHLHGSRVAELPFPLSVRNHLIAAGKAEPHRYLPTSGWVTHHIRGEDDIPNVVELFRLNYERPWLKK